MGELGLKLERGRGTIFNFVKAKPWVLPFCL